MVTSEPYLHDMSLDAVSFGVVHPAHQTGPLTL